MCKKLITCFGVVHKNYPNKLLTIVSSKEEAFEYVENVLKLSHVEDYRAWGYFNHIDNLADPSNWISYARNRINPSELSPYSIVKCKFNTRGISMAFRVLNSCIPIGCSFDDGLEYENTIRLASHNDEIKAVIDIVSDCQDLNPNLSPEIRKLLTSINELKKRSQDVKQ